MKKNAESHPDNFPLAGGAQDGYSTESEATATCYCGAVQMAFSTQKADILSSFICHCTDCRKITASAFTSAFFILERATRFIRGEDKTTTFTQSDTIWNGRAMSNVFCATCGTLMYRQQGKDKSGKASEHIIMRIGTVDDFSLHETLLKPDVELWTGRRMGWCSAVQGLKQSEGNKL